MNIAIANCLNGIEANKGFCLTTLKRKLSNGIQKTIRLNNSQKFTYQKYLRYGQLLRANSEEKEDLQITHFQAQEPSIPYWTGQTNLKNRKENLPQSQEILFHHSPFQGRSVGNTIIFSMRELQLTQITTLSERAVLSYVNFTK